MSALDTFATIAIYGLGLGTGVYVGFYVGRLWQLEVGRGRPGGRGARG